MYGPSYDRYVDSSTMSKVQQQYWSTKQTVLKKLGKKEDECIVASDAELDSKLEMFHAIQESCVNLMRVLELYQDKLLVLAQEENSTGRFLKECGKQDKTRAGKMMIATGKTLSYTAQKRLDLRGPLVRLYQEVETFQVRAITDTFITVDKMEKSRTVYRGNLMWMKDISQQLDPDMNRQLEKFRKVQGHVRKTKVKFDKLKVDTLQKVDLLSASRCNMFSHALVSYQNTLLQFWEKTSKTMTTVADSFKGYQHYEFNMLKELTESSKKLAEETSNSLQLDIDEEDEVEDKDKLIFFDAEYRDDEGKKKEKDDTEKKSDSLQNLYNSPVKSINNTKKPSKSSSKTDSLIDESPLLNLQDVPPNPPPEPKVNQTKNSWQTDLLTGNPEIDDCDKDDLTLLNDILNGPSSGYQGMSTHPLGSFAADWQAAFGDQSPDKPVGGDWANSTVDSNLQNQDLAALGSTGNLDKEVDMILNGGQWQLNSTLESNTGQGFLPSQLLQMNSTLAACSLSDSASNHMTLPANYTTPSQVEKPKTNSKPMSAAPLSKKNKKDMSAWFNLFADLDPLGNPDALGLKAGLNDEDRSC